MWVCTSTFPHVQEVEVDVVIDEGFCSTVSVEEAETLRRDITRSRAGGSSSVSRLGYLGGGSVVSSSVVHIIFPDFGHNTTGKNSKNMSFKTCRWFLTCFTHQTCSIQPSTIWTRPRLHCNCNTTDVGL